MNALPFSHRPPRLRAGLTITLTVVVGAAGPATALGKTDGPSSASLPRCGACVVAAPELIDLAAAALIGANAGEALDHATRAVEDASAVHNGVRIANHPHAFRPWIRWANANMRIGRSFWKAFDGKLGRIYRSLRRSYSLKKLRKKLPRAAVACVVSGTVTGIHTGSVKDAAWSCLGAALGVLSAAKGPAHAHGFN